MTNGFFNAWGSIIAVYFHETGISISDFQYEGARCVEGTDDNLVRSAQQADARMTNGYRVRP